jgi:DNA-binding MarR family transcriptional regulator
MAFTITKAPDRAAPDGGRLMPDHSGHVVQETEQNLGYLVNRAARLMAQSMGQRLRRHGILLGQWAVLLFLYERDGQSQAELARVVAIEQPTMVRTIDRMVRDGLVTREPDPTDRRVTRIKLTDKARALEDALYAESIDANRVAESALSPAERDQLVDYLHRFIGTLLPNVSESSGAANGGRGGGWPAPQLRRSRAEDR